MGVDDFANFTNAFLVHTVGRRVGGHQAGQLVAGFGGEEGEYAVSALRSALSAHGLALALALGLLAGCATHWDVDSFEAPAGNVASRHTYFWQGGDFGTPGAVDPAMVALASTQLRGAVTAELNRKGFKEVDAAAAADMIVSFQVSGTQRFVPSDERRIGAPSATTVLRLVGAL